MNLRSEVSIKVTLPEKDNIFVCRDCGRENVEENNRKYVPLPST